MNKKGKIILIIVVIIIAICLFIGYKLTRIDNSYDFKVYFFNAGKADAILFSKNNHYMMIDTGEETLSDDILRYFNENNIKKLDYLIITHFDKDHVGSAAKILENIEVGQVYQSNYHKESEYYDAYLAALDKKEITPIIVSSDLELSLSDIEIVINGSIDVYDKNENNNSSLIVSVKYNENKFLFMGDAQNQRIKDFLSNNNETYDFLKVPYHGHYLKRLEDLLQNKEIKYSVITSSNEELEDTETIDLLNKYNIDNYLTRKGSILVLSNGKDIVIKQ